MANNDDDKADTIFSGVRKNKKLAKIVGETELERSRRLGRERRNRWFANRTEQQLAEIRRANAARKRYRLAKLKKDEIEKFSCLHCNGSDSVTVDINKIKFPSNGQMYTLGECYTLLTGIKIESGQSKNCKICQMCQNQLIATYNMKRQFLQQVEPKIKKEVIDPKEMGQDTKPLITSLPELGKPIMPQIEHSKNQCTICMKRFDGVLPYRRHMKIHQDQLFCEHCSFKTKDRSKLRDHIKTHNDRHTCSVCSEKFPTNYLRKRHLKMKHIVSNVGGEYYQILQIFFKETFGF
jgi:hypothetical protein